MDLREIFLADRKSFPDSRNEYKHIVLNPIKHATYGSVKEIDPCPELHSIDSGFTSDSSPRSPCVWEGYFDF